MRNENGFPMATLRVPSGSERMFRRFWREVFKRGEDGPLMGMDPAVDAMLADPSHPDAVVTLDVAEVFMDRACDVPGWDRLDGDPRPIDFIPPGCE